MRMMTMTFLRSDSESRMLNGVGWKNTVGESTCRSVTGSIYMDGTGLDRVPRRSNTPNLNLKRPDDLQCHAKSLAKSDWQQHSPTSKRITSARDVNWRSSVIPGITLGTRRHLVWVTDLSYLSRIYTVSAHHLPDRRRVAMPINRDNPSPYPFVVS
jgi:hypothetical protein